MRKLLLVPVLLALAGCGAVGGGSYGAQDARDGAAFRLEAREIVGRLNPVCPYTQNTEQLARYDEPKARYDKLKEWVADTPFAVDLAIIEADYAQYWTANVAECGPVDTDDSLATLNGEMEALNARLSTLEQMAGVI